MRRNTQYYIGLFLLIFLGIYHFFYHVPKQPIERGVVSSQFIETNTFADILKYIKPNSLVLMDIDDTLMEPKQTLGSDAWFQWRTNYYKKKGIEPRLAFETALMDWVSVQCLTEVQLVEPGIDKLVKRMQDEGFHVMGLSTRGGSLATRTGQQLKSINIDLSKGAPVREEKLFLNPHEVIFKNGTLFTSGTHKGEALFKFLEIINGQYPMDQIEDVVFINDKETQLVELQETCLEHGIPFIGVRYGYSDERVHNFSEKVALYQFEQFGKIISDAEAEQKLGI